LLYLHFIYTILLPIIKKNTHPFLVNYTPPTVDCTFDSGGRHGRGCMVVGFTITYTISAYHH